MKTALKIELLKNDNTSIVVDLLSQSTIFDNNIIKFKKTENCGVLSFKTKVELGKNYQGYSFIFDYFFNELIDESDFFAPSAYYGNIHNPSKLYFYNNISAGGVDMISAPVMCFYNHGVGYVLRDLTPGRRDTSCLDHTIGDGNKILVNDYFNLPGLGVRSENGQVVLEYRYPAQTFNNIQPNKNLRRFLNVKTAEFSFDLRKMTSKSYNEFWVKVWREEFDRRERIENGINTEEALQSIIDYACDGYGIRNGNPEFFTNTDHFTRESGFLYRNSDIAYLLIEAKIKGYKVSLSYEQLIGVIDNQVNNEYIGKNMMWPFARSRVEGNLAVFKAYKLLKTIGISKESWMKYVLNEMELILDTNDYFEIPMLVEIYEYNGEKKYLNSAIRKGELMWDTKLSKNNFSGSITDFVGLPSLDKETGLLSFVAYIRLYEATKEKKYLEYAKHCANYAETYTQLCNLNLETGEYDDTSSYINLAHGNSHINSQGLSYVSITCAVGDNGNLFSAYDFVKLANYTGDEHYRDFAKFIYINSYNIVSLDDKTGGMDDYLYCTRFGFTPEYVALASSIDGACHGRGRMHDSNLGWVVYGFLYSGLQFAEDKSFKDFRSDKRYKIIEVKSIETSGNELSNVNLLTGGRATFFDAGKAKEIRLNFEANTSLDKVVVSYQNPGISTEFKLYYLKNNRKILVNSFKHVKGFYDVIDLGISAASLIFEFEQKDRLYVSGIVPFGITKNELNHYLINDSRTYVKEYLEDNVRYFINGEPLLFNDRVGTYCGDHAEFLRGGLARFFGCTASLKFNLKANKSIFWFRKSLCEPIIGDANIKLNLNGKETLDDLLGDETIYLDLNQPGEIEIIFSTKERAFIEFGYLEIKELKLYE